MRDIVSISINYPDKEFQHTANNAVECVSFLFSIFGDDDAHRVTQCSALLLVNI